MSSFGKIELTGPDALPHLERVAGNLIDRPVGSVVYTQLLEKNGGIVADVTITRLSQERFQLVTGAGFVNSDLGWLRLQASGESPRVGIRETSDELSVIGLWGPDARDVMQRVTVGDVSDSAFPFMTTQPLRIANTNLLAQRVTYVGELGWELYVDPARAGQVWDRLLDAGRDFGITPGGYRVLDSLDSRSHVAFTLRHFEGYELTEVAAALSCSLATVKRVLSAVETRVWSLAAQDPYLAPYLEPREPRG